MKIFFVLASLIYFPCSVVLDMNDCGSGISDDCQMEWDDKESEEKFYERCDSEGGSNPLRWRCSLCCPDSTCDAVCGCGFSYTPEGLDGTGKTFTNPGEGIDNCATDCRARDGCTSFEYNHEGDEGFLCGTYTGGSDNLRPSGQKSTWTSCVQACSVDGNAGDGTTQGSCASNHLCQADGACQAVGSWTMTEEGKFCRETIAEDFKDGLVVCEAYCEENGAKTLSFNTVANTNYDQYYCRCCTESSELKDASCYEHSCNQMYTLLD